MKRGSLWFSGNIPQITGAFFSQDLDSSYYKDYVKSLLQRKCSDVR